MSISLGGNMRPAFAAIINMLQESDWVMDRVSGTLSAPAQAVDMNKKKALKPDHRKRMKKAMHKHLASKSRPSTTTTTVDTQDVKAGKTGMFKRKKSTPITTAGTQVTDPSK